MNDMASAARLAEEVEELLQSLPGSVRHIIDRLFEVAPDRYAANAISRIVRRHGWRESIGGIARTEIGVVEYLVNLAKNAL